MPAPNREEGDMNPRMISFGLAGVMVASVLAWTPAAFADMVKYKADLKASNEVPAVDSKATGALEATYDTASKKLTYTVNYKDLSGPATAAHFHGPADAKANAGVVVPVQGAVTSPIKGEATLTDAQAADLAAGKWYFNVHTAANKGGEIRGQVMK